MKNYNRRDFLKQVAVGSLYLGSGVSVLNADSSGDESRFDDYKAIVYVYHDGGNDGINTFIPASEDRKKGYPNYHSIRNNVRVSDKELELKVVNGQLDLSSGNPYNVDNKFTTAYTKGFYRHEGLDLATNPLMPEVAHLVNQGKVAIIANCGNLIEPATKKDFADKKKPLPPFLYSHSHQTKITQNGIAGVWDATGWAGRVYDLLENVNGNTEYNMNISVSGGITHIFDANKTSPLILSPHEPIKYSGVKREIYNNYLAIKKENMFRDLYNRLRKHSFIMQDILQKDWKNSPDFKDVLNAYGGQIFTRPSHDQLQESKPYCDPIFTLYQFRAIAKYAKIAKDKGIKRQIFFLFDGGYDTHKNQTLQHARKMRELSLGIGDFYRALESLDMQNDIVTMTASDFGRSTGNNDDGTDHAWGSNYFVVGGAIKGGIYGTLPDLTLGSDDDLTHKGRLIPSTSMSQYYATITKWFGLSDEENDIIFPELSKFPKRDLGFL